jgi:hypothetical protein
MGVGYIFSAVNGELTLFLGTLTCTGLSTIPQIVYLTFPNKNLKQRRFAVRRQKI